jgi:alpha-L-fucosidase
MTICRQWAWKPNDEMKSLQQCVQTLLYTIGGDGNLLFNVGPMPDGRIEPRQVDRLKEMGEWVEAHSQAIYGTRGGPIKPGAWGASTCKDNHVYLFVMNWPAEGALRLPDLGVKVLDAKLLNGGEVTREIADGAMHLSVPADRRDEIATVIQLTVEGRAWDIAPRDAARGLSGSLAYNKAAKASNVFGNQIGEYGPMAALDDDPATRWATDANVDSASLDIDLGEPRTINRLKIVEPAEFQRVKQFQLEYRNGTDWKTCYTGAKIGPNFEATFDPVTTPRVRLRILEAPGGPTLSEVQLFGTKSN